MVVYNQSAKAITYQITVPNGGGAESQSFFLTHVWGSPYEQGYYFGQSLSNQTQEFIGQAWDYILSDVEEILYPYLPRWAADLISAIGLDAALDMVYEETKA